MEESTVDIVIATAAVEHFSKHPSIKLFGGIKTKMPLGAPKTPKVRPPKGGPQDEVGETQIPQFPLFTLDNSLETHTSSITLQ